MKILVTGAAGSVGAFVVRELLEHGHQVRAFDMAPPAADLKARVEMVYGDICDRLATLRAVQGCDAIAHLAAIPNPLGGNNTKLFGPNVLGLQQILAAAEAEGIQRVAIASSCAVYGSTFAQHPFNFAYLPIDEKHPLCPEDLYGLSKQVGEAITATYSRRSGMATTCLRFTWVVDFEKWGLERRRGMLERSHNHRVTEMWHFIEARDVARAFRLALENVTQGHHVALIVSRDLTTDHPISELIARHHPTLAPFLDSGWDYEKYGLFDTRTAEELFGFVAQHGWRDGLDALNGVNQATTHNAV